MCFKVDFGNHGNPHQNNVPLANQMGDGFNIPIAVHLPGPHYHVVHHQLTIIYVPDMILVMVCIFSFDLGFVLVLLLTSLVFWCN